MDFSIIFLMTANRSVGAYGTFRVVPKAFALLARHFFNCVADKEFSLDPIYLGVDNGSEVLKSCLSGLGWC